MQQIMMIHFNDLYHAAIARAIAFAIEQPEASAQTPDRRGVAEK